MNIDKIEKGKGKDDEREGLNTTTTTMVKTESSLFKDDLVSFDIEKDIRINKDKYMGNIIGHTQPRRLGNTFAFMYKNGEPRIVIGPHCILIIFY